MNTRSRRYYIGKQGDPHTTFAFRYCHHRTIPRDLVQAVWEAITQESQATLRSMEHDSGIPRSRIGFALLFLRHHGLVLFEDKSTAARAIPPPKYAVKASYFDD